MHSYVTAEQLPFPGRALRPFATTSRSPPLSPISYWYCFARISFFAPVALPRGEEQDFETRQNR